MQKHKFISIFIFLLAITIFSAILIACSSNSPVSSGPELFLSDCDFNLANSKQFKPSVTLGVYNGILYMWHPREHVLMKYQDGAFQKVCNIDGYCIGFSDGIFYYESSAQGKDYTYNINQYSLENATHTELLQRGITIESDHYFTADGILHVAVDKFCSVYKEIHKGVVVGEHSQPESYTVGSDLYSLTGGDTRESILTRKDSLGQEMSYKGIIPYGMKYVVPCEYGLLVHNENSGGDLLYLVKAGSGDVVALFNTECIYSQSAFNFYGDYAYLSLIRYTQWGPLGLGGLRDEQDQVNGTYRINLKNYSVEKVSDAVYNGLFIFDDTGIFACNDDYRVFKLDWNGSVLFELTTNTD